MNAGIGGRHARHRLQTGTMSIILITIVVSHHHHHIYVAAIRITPISEAGLPLTWNMVGRP